MDVLPDAERRAERHRIDETEHLGQYSNGAAERLLQQFPFRCHETVLLQRRRDRFDDGRRWAGLRQKPKDMTLIDGFDCSSDRAVACQHHPDGVWKLFANFGKEVDAIHPGHVHVGHDHSEFLGAHQVQRFRTAGSRVDFELSKRATMSGQDVRVVVDEQDRVTHTAPMLRVGYR